MALTPDQAIELVRTKLWPLLELERTRVRRIDKWMRWDHDDPYRPRYATREHRDLSTRAQAPWGRRVVTSVTDQLYVEGYRPAEGDENSTAWEWWQANGLDARQIAFHEAMVGYGLCYSVVLPGKSWLGDRMPVIRGLDPSQMVAVYEDPAWDDWPAYALRAVPTKVGTSMSWKLRLYDASDVHSLVMTESGERLQHVESKAHDVGVCPVVRFTNHLDLRGRADGDIEPIIPVLGRIDQTAYDRLVVQRFSSWKVRTIAGMSPPETLDGETEAQYRQRTKQRLQVEDILVADDADTKFGTLDETSLSGFIEAHDADVRVLAAVSQSPAHELIGQMANLSAESLAAAEASLTRRVVRTKHPAGESWEQTLRLGGKVMGDDQAAKDFSSQVVWRDMESRSLSQEADALGKLATLLGIPVQVLWDKVSILTQTDVELAKKLAEQAGGVEALLQQLVGNQQPALT